MKKTNRNRMAAPVSASFALLLALSACSSSGVNQGGGTNNSGSSESASAPTEDGRQIVGLGDDNKAGKPRPRSERETRGNQNQVKSDGSWTEKTLSGQEKITVNADGTWVNKTGEKEFTLHADGSWESTEKLSNSKTVIHVNPDGSWSIQEQRKENKEPSNKAEVRADGTWEVDELGVKYVGKADGTATKKDSKADEEKPISRSEWPDIFPKYVASLYKEDGSLVTSVPKDGVIPLKPRTALPLGVSAKKAVPETDEYRRGLVKPFDYERSSIVQRTDDIKYGVGSNGVIPLIPRTPLPRGVKAVQAPVGSEQERVAIAQQQRLVLTDDNKAGKEPRRRETESHDWGLSNVHLKDDGSYSYSAKEGKGTAEVAADGTWKSKSSDGDTTTLHADGSWDSYTEKTKVNMHVNPNGTWVKKTGESAKIQMFADGSWCYEYKDSEITYGTPDGKIYEGVSDKKWREVAQKTWENRSSDKSIKDPETPLAPLTVKDSVIPLRARNPIAAGQKAFP